MHAGFKDTRRKNKRVFIVAEISANHGQNFKHAVTLINKAKECGADAVKFQAYTPDTLTLNVDNKYFRIKHPKWGGQTLYQLYQKAYTPWKWFRALKKVAEDIGIVFFATAFDKSSVDFLEEIGVPFHKIASFELVDLPLIEYAAKTKRPLILSTGMANLSEISDAVQTSRKWTKEVILLKCVSSYPAEPKYMNLNTIPDLKKRFRCAVGLSDHTLGIATSITAVSLGAQMIEKHFALSRSISSPDSFFSLIPDEFRNLVKNIRISEESQGRIFYGLTPEEKRSRVFRKSIFVSRNIASSELFTEENVRSLRPAYGLAPKYLKDVLGKKASRNLKKGTPLNWDCILKKKAKQS